MNEQKLFEIWNQAEEIDCSLRELTDSELIECRSALLERVQNIMADCDNLIQE
jgi:hypothetical protein